MMKGRTQYAESLVSDDDDEAMSSDADLTETEVAETLEFEWYAKGNEYYLFFENEIIYLVYTYIIYRRF